jgi:hypothetical protein
MNRIVFLLEERSMKILLDSLLPRLFPGLSFICLAHEGKQDLEKSIIRKLKAWKEPGVQFVIVRDNDDTDCLALKQKLKKLCDLAGRSDTLIRIVCQELEAWYFAEPKALVEAYGKSQLLLIENKSRYREPDKIHKPSKEIVKLIPEFQKLSGAKRLAKYLTRKGNRSNSYCVFMDGIEKIFSQMKPTNTK